MRCLIYVKVERFNVREYSSLTCFLMHAVCVLETQKAYFLLAVGEM